MCTYTLMHSVWLRTGMYHTRTPDSSVDTKQTFFLSSTSSAGLPGECQWRPHPGKGMQQSCGTCNHRNSSAPLQAAAKLHVPRLTIGSLSFRPTLCTLIQLGERLRRHVLEFLLCREHKGGCLWTVLLYLDGFCLESQAIQGVDGFFGILRVHVVHKPVAETLACKTTAQHTDGK